ncbi:MAG: KTSC domain-containing protein [Desulfobacteraceae bacterium]|nr:KTSC domain-containing protein [Desulfobacteraceae bacterium]
MVPIPHPCAPEPFKSIQDLPPAAASAQQRQRYSPLQKFLENQKQFFPAHTISELKWKRSAIRKNNNTYHYCRVPNSIFKDWVEAPSKVNFDYSVGG